jgi:hypothetical protein
MHVHLFAPELVSNRRHPQPRGALTIRMDVRRAGRGRRGRRGRA